MARKPLLGRKGIQADLIDLLALGDGPKKSPAYWFAKAAEAQGVQARVVAVDLQKPKYRQPSTMTFIDANAIKYLETVPPGSVKKIRDDYFFHLTLWGQDRKRLRKFIAAVAIGDTGAIAQLKRNESKYAKLVKRALVPGGQFIVTTESKLAPTIVTVLQKEGFIVASRKLKILETLRAGSFAAKRSLFSGIRTFQIIATKPANH